MVITPRGYRCFTNIAPLKMPLKRIREIYREWRGYRSFAALKFKDPSLVFYSEGSESWCHFESIIKALWESTGQKVIYVTSDENESRLLSSSESVSPFYIGEGFVRTIFFSFLKVDVLAMTMPDLQTYHIKRSAHSVHYAYIFHSMVSTHMTYRPGAFDHFDSIFCVGPHHIEEIRARETQIKSGPKNLIQHGYGRLDDLIGKEREKNNTYSPGSPIHILIAPSWGKNSLLDRCGGDFIRLLLEEGFHVTLRPHPQTRLFSAEMLNSISNALKSYPGFILEDSVITTRSLIDADVMVSDWSGAAFEFAFSRLKPVLFVDVPRKVNNPGYETLHIEPLEVSIRDEIGIIMGEDKLHEMGDRINQLVSERDLYADKIKACREANIYHIGNSGRTGALELLKILEAHKNS